MQIDPRHLAPCGLYCGVCAVLYASRDDNRKFKELLAGLYKGKLPDSDNLSVEDIHCEGCLSEHPFGFCRTCGIKDCVRQKGIQGCHQCSEFPCPLVESFPMPAGKKVILRTIPYWKEHGTEVFVRDEEARYVCPDCGNRLFRGARRCNRCKKAVDLD